MTSRFATPPELIGLENAKSGYCLPEDVFKSWKDFETSCLQTAAVLRTSFERNNPKNFLVCSIPTPYQFGYSKAYSTEKKARFALSESLDAFVLLLAYVSFCIAICRAKDDPDRVSFSTSTVAKPRWFQILSDKSSKIHPQWLQLLVDSPVADFTPSTPQRLGTIVNVARCSWIKMVPYLLWANVPVWLYWGIPPVFVQPLEAKALVFAPRSHPQYRAPRLPVITPSLSVGLPTPSHPQSCAPPLPVITPSQSVGFPTPSQSVSLRSPTPSQSVRLPVRSAHAGPGQLPGEMWKDFMIRQSIRRKAKLEKESDRERQAREGCELSAAKRQCPGKRGPTVFTWEEDNGVWTQTLLTRAQVEGTWGAYSSSQKIFNSVDNCWDLCHEFDEGTLGNMYEYDSNDSDDDTYRPKISQQSPTPKNGRSGDDSACPPTVVGSKSTPQSVLVPVKVSSDITPMDVDPTPPQISLDPPPMVVDSSPAQISDPPPMPVDPTPQISSDPPSESMLVDASDPVPLPLSMPLQNSNPQSEEDLIDSDEDDKDPYDASKRDVLNAYSFVALDLEEMPVTTLDDLLYYRYGFSLSELPYTGIPLSVTKAETRTFRSWTEVCRAVGGQQLESSAVEDRAAIQDFLSILAGSSSPFEDVPGKYWDLSSSGLVPIVDLDKVFISIEERQFNDGKHYIIRPRSLHESRDVSWLLSVDPMTALECIRHGLGPHTIDIANFLISHGVPFRTLQRIRVSNSENSSVRPRCRYLGYRSVDYSFDLADLAGYEALRDSFLRSQSHGPLALREGGIIARLAREVLPNSNALSGPSSDALSGHRARFIFGDEIYVDDNFLEDELGLICGTYVLGNQNVRRGNELSLFSSC